MLPVLRFAVKEPPDGGVTAVRAVASAPVSSIGVICTVRPGGHAALLIVHCVAAPAHADVPDQDVTVALPGVPLVSWLVP